MLKRNKKISYDISINKKCPNCRLYAGYYYRCEKHRKHYIEHWEKQIK